MSCLADEEADFRLRKTCRLCDGSTRMALELPPTPPANELVTREFVESGQKQDVFPLEVMVCTKCGHVQLSGVVAPERLFRATPYRSGTSPVFREHLHKYAVDVMARFGVPKFVVEIGSNDGTFLKHFSDSKRLGVDPSACGLEEMWTLKYRFTRALAQSVRRAHPPGADLIVANHVFAHIDDLRDVALGVRELLSDDGVFIFEVGYLVDVLEKTLFDVIYHEHLSYHHLAPLIPFFERLGLNLFDAERVDTQGGAIRCYVKSAKYPVIKTDQLVALLDDEAAELGYDMGGIGELGVNIARIKTELGGTLSTLKEQGAHIVGYGAPAKCCTLMHTLGFGPEVLDFIVDDNPVKHGLYTPGKHVEIRPVSALYETKPDFVLVLAWNFAEDIVRKHPHFRFIVPLSLGQQFEGDYVVVCGHP
jgi:SAM-dependent methyltransferase